MYSESSQALRRRAPKELPLGAGRLCRNSKLFNPALNGPSPQTSEDSSEHPPCLPPVKADVDAGHGGLVKGMKVEGAEVQGPDLGGTHQTVFRATQNGSSFAALD